MTEHFAAAEPDDLPPLTGSPAQVALATDLRRHNVSGTEHLAPLVQRVLHGIPSIYDTPTIRRVVDDVVRRQTSATWWITRNTLTREDVLGSRDVTGAATVEELREIYDNRTGEPEGGRTKQWTRNVLKVDHIDPA